MSELQSNYPRGVEIRKDVDIPGLRLWARVGLGVAITFGSLVAVTKIEAVAVGTWDMNSVALWVISFFIGLAAILLMVCIAVWTAKAYLAVCTLRGMKPKLHPAVVGIFSAIPLIFLFLPLFYTLEFLIIRSKDSETPIMGKGNYFSWSPLANNFGFSILAFVISSLTINFPEDNKIRLFLSHLSNFSLLYALVAGCVIVFQVNRNIAKLSTQN